MKVKITSDSTCDLSPELIEKYDIAITPLSVHCGDKVGRDGVEITPEIIYDYVDASGQLPRTSAVNVFDYVREFRHWRQQGYSIVHFCISSDFSSSYQNACIAAADIGQVYVVDSRNLSTGQGLLVLHGAELAAAGQTAGQGASLLLQQAGAALLPGVLVAADDHGVLVLPQVEDAGVVRHMLRQVLLQGQVAIGIGSVAGIGIQVLDHGFLQRRIGCRAAFTSSGRPMGIWWGAPCMASGSS